MKRLKMKKRPAPKKKAAKVVLAKAPVVAKAPVLASRPVVADTPQPERAEAEIAAVQKSAYSPEDHTALRLYMREIGETPLLTPGEEVVLAKRVKRGDKKAREQMIKANLRLVVKIARDYEGYGVPLLDLISEGNIGLMKGVERFDPAKGAKLSTYSAWWIKQTIKRALANQSKTIRLPVHAVDKLLHIRRAAARLQDILGREATLDELAQETSLTPREVNRLRTAALRPASLDAPIGEDETSRVAEIVADENAVTPDEDLQDQNDTQMVRQIVDTLDPREREILELRFGLKGDDEQTLEEVGRKFKLTRERIRQIQEIALRKLRKKIQNLERNKMAA